MEQDVKPNEVIFELQEVPGPDFALKQMGDTMRMVPRSQAAPPATLPPTPRAG